MFLVRDLGLPPAIVGVSIGIGAFLGTLLAERFTRRFGVGRTIIGSLIIIPLWSGLLLLPLTTWSVSMVSGVLFIMQLMGDIAWSVFFINVVTLRQALIPTHLLGRANASLGRFSSGLRLLPAFCERSFHRASAAVNCFGPTESSTGQAAIGIVVPSQLPENSIRPRNNTAGSRVRNRRRLPSIQWIAATVPQKWIRVSHSSVPRAASGQSLRRFPVKGSPAGDQCTLA